MEKMRTAIATDLHDDIGSSLARNRHLERSGASPTKCSQPTRAAQRLPAGYSVELERELVDSINDIAWTIRSGDETVESLVRRMREFAAEFLENAAIGLSFQAADPRRVCGSRRTRGGGTSS